MSDNNSGTSSSTVSITVTGSNDGPTADVDTGTTDENAVISIEVLANDTDVDDNDTHTVDRVSITLGNGSVTIVGNQVQWTPGTDYDYLADGESATVELAYDISDNSGGTVSSTVSIMLVGSNDGPVVTTATGENEGAVIEAGSDTGGAVVVFGNSIEGGTLTSSDADMGASATWTGNATGFYGCFVIDANGAWGYTLNNSDADTDALSEGQIVADTFTATVTDDFGATATQLVNITVTGTNDGPVAVADTGVVDESASVTINVLNNDADVDDNHTLSLDSVSSAKGTATIVADVNPTQPTLNT
jgi:VCBS repeat-containing protein